MTEDKYTRSQAGLSSYSSSTDLSPPPEQPTCSGGLQAWAGGTGQASVWEASHFLLEKRSHCITPLCPLDLSLAASQGLPLAFPTCLVRPGGCRETQASTAPPTHEAADLALGGAHV